MRQGVRAQPTTGRAREPNAGMKTFEIYTRIQEVRAQRDEMRSKNQKLEEEIIILVWKFNELAHRINQCPRELLTEAQRNEITQAIRPHALPLARMVHQWDQLKADIDKWNKFQTGSAVEGSPPVGYSE